MSSQINYGDRQKVGRGLRQLEQPVKARRTERGSISAGGPALAVFMTLMLWAAIPLHAYADAPERALGVSTETGALSTRPTRTITLTPLELAPLGLKHTGDALRYVEDGVTITVRTNGISARGERIPSDLRTPRHITLYRKGVNHAQWLDATAADTDVNTLIGIQVWLRDTTMPMFPEADVILWYAPTREFIDVLPDTLRRQLLTELNTSAPTTEYVERRTASASITSMIVAPNPVRSATATLQLTVQDACIAGIRVVDMMGRETGMRSMENYTLSVGKEVITITDIDGMPSGMYSVVVDIPATNERLVHRLLVER